MNGYNEEKYVPERIRSGVNIPIKTIEVDLKAGENVEIMQPVYYNSTSKAYTSVSDSGELYGFSAVKTEADSKATSTTRIPIYATGEFYKSAIVIVNEEDIEAITVAARKIGIFLE